MAGWKLRKDKTESETPQTENLVETAVPSSEFLVAPLPAESQTDFTPWEAPTEEAEHEPAKVFDLSEDPNEETSALPADYLTGFHAPTEEPDEEAVPEMEAEAPLLFTEEEEPETLPAAETDSFSSTMRIERSELAAALPSSAETTVPTVAPFILDLPPSALPASETAHRLIVQIGRLSAPFDLTKEVTGIGRPDSKLHYYPDVEIELDDAISRRHAEIIHRGEAYYVADAGSTNGTMLNGEALPPHEERLLAHGDRIRLGERTEIHF